MVGQSRECGSFGRRRIAALAPNFGALNSAASVALAGALLFSGSASASETPQVCPEAPPPVLSLAYGSRYEADSDTRSDIDEAANKQVEDSQKPVDDFIRSLADQVNAIRSSDDKQSIADCATAQIAVWARAGALEQLETPTSRMTIGSRLAAIALVLRQAQGHGGADADWAVIRAWLARLNQSQLAFWEEDAPSGARKGNLRAWAALSAVATAEITDDPILRAWGVWSASYVTCTANADGSLPQEMTRGRLALHYQLHAVAPLVVTARILKDHGMDVLNRCDKALSRVVRFTLADLEAGQATQSITGEVQSFFDGTRQVSGYHLAWLEAWIALEPSENAVSLAKTYRPLSSSKLGGDQSFLWQEDQER